MTGVGERALAPASGAGAAFTAGTGAGLEEHPFTTMEDQ
jgi:hypothetical protein